MSWWHGEGDGGGDGEGNGGGDGEGGGGGGQIINKLQMSWAEVVLEQTCNQSASEALMMLACGDSTRKSRTESGVQRGRSGSGGAAGFCCASW